MQASIQELARLQAARAAGEKSLPQLATAENAAREAMKIERAAYDRVRKDEVEAKRPVEAKTQAWQAAEKKLATLKSEKDKADQQGASLAKSLSEKRAALAAAEKKPDAGQVKSLGKEIAPLEKQVASQQVAITAATEKLKQAQAALDKAAAEKAAAEKVLAEKSTLAKAALDKQNAAQAKHAQADKDRKTTQDSLRDMTAKIKQLTAAAPQEKAAAEKAAADRAAAEKALADRQVALKAALEGAAAAKASAERAKVEKATLDKTRTAQAQAGN
jgi:chromosome segregation ATPase